MKKFKFYIDALEEGASITIGDIAYDLEEDYKNARKWGFDCSLEIDEATGKGFIIVGDDVDVIDIKNVCKRVYVTDPMTHEFYLGHLEADEEIIEVGLCSGRHEIVASDGKKISQFIFNGDLDPADVAGIQKAARDSIWDIVKHVPVHCYAASTLNVYIDPAEDTDIGDRKRECALHIYVTGLSVALIAAIKAAASICRHVVLMHYDMSTGKYYPQEFC